MQGLLERPNSFLSQSIEYVNTQNIVSAPKNRGVSSLHLSHINLFQCHKCSAGCGRFDLLYADIRPSFVQELSQGSLGTTSR